MGVRYIKNQKSSEVKSVSRCIQKNSYEEKPIKLRSNIKIKNFGFAVPILTPYIVEMVKAIPNMLDIS